MATHSIGTSSRDYSTLQLWEDACPADITAGGTNEIWKGEAYKDSTFTGTLAIAGMTTDATHYVWLTTAAGESFVDTIAGRTTALDYGLTGVKQECGLYQINITNSVGSTVIENIQIKNLSYFMLAGGPRVKNCIFKGQRISGGGLFSNCLMIETAALEWSGGGALDGSTYEFTTLINASGGSASLGGVLFGGTATIENCSYFGFTTDWAVTFGTLAGGHNCTDLGTAPGSNNQVSKTFSNNVVNTTNDFRAKSGGDVENNGTPATSFTTVDISGFSRSATTPTIGAWELSSGGFVSPPGNSTQFFNLLGVGT